MVAEHHRQGSTPIKLIVKKKEEVSQKGSCKSAKNQAAISLWVYANRYKRFSCVVKSFMGIQRFEVRFFLGKKFTKIDLVLTLVIKNYSKVGYTRSIKFLRI